MTLTLALSKGRIFEDTLPLLAQAGIELDVAQSDSRRLILDAVQSDVRIIMVRASDVPTYVQYGAADMGVAGSDVLMESDCSGIYQPLDLAIARCRLSIATRKDCDYDALLCRNTRLRVASKYRTTTLNFFAQKSIHVDVIKLYGSMELAPLVGLADAIVDVVSSGKTLEANALKEVEKIADVSARLIVNQSALKLKRQRLLPFLDKMSAALEG